MRIPQLTNATSLHVRTPLNSEAAEKGQLNFRTIRGLHLRYPEAELFGRMLDHSVPEVTLRALSHFTRVPLLELRKLDLSVRVPRLNSAFLLRFQDHELSRGHSLRVRYSFCPQCLSQQRRLHIRWDWCFAALIRCAVHRSALLDACPHCGDVDALNFSPLGARALLCRSCSGDLTRSSEVKACLRDDDIIFLLETAYRSALHEIAPHTRVTEHATDRAFRRFVEDMLQILVEVLSSSPSEPISSLHGVALPRRGLLAIITELIRNAIPTSDAARRNARYRRNLVLWSGLFQVMSERQGEQLECRAHFWPEFLRRRFATALEHRRRKRWPYRPYSSPALSLRFKCSTLAAVFDLSAEPRPQTSKSRI